MSTHPYLILSTAERYRLNHVRIRVAAAQQWRERGRNNNNNINVEAPPQAVRGNGSEMPVGPPVALNVIPICIACYEEWHGVQLLVQQCGHTVCDNCAPHLIEDGIIKCPECRVEQPSAENRLLYLAARP